MQNDSLTQGEVEALWAEHVSPEHRDSKEAGNMCAEEELAFFRHAVNQLCSSGDSEEKGEDDDSEEEDRELKTGIPSLRGVQDRGQVEGGALKELL